MFMRPLSNHCFRAYIGGLWILYTTTGLYGLMHQNGHLHASVHFHVSIAGYLFTASMFYMHPAPTGSASCFELSYLKFHWPAMIYFLNAHPPSGVNKEQAENGGMLMYYAGDAIDVVLICILYYQWFKATRPKGSLAL
jgi:putative membrane protein